ncbi:hypothetical protein Lal_00037583 [Lupinus albus]|nr:hypothetical protein Lal_00037583 [Lupinus albus]
MKYNININWTQMIMRQMWNVRDSQSSLSYVIFINKVLEHFGVSLDSETKVALNLRESKIDVEFLLIVAPVGIALTDRMLLLHNQNLPYLTSLSFKLHLPHLLPCLQIR